MKNNEFTKEERKEIFDDWRKHIKSIPTEKEMKETLAHRKKMKKYMQKRRSQKV